MAKRKSGKYPELEGFISAKEHMDRERFKILLNVRARGKCGKSRFPLSAPRPLAYYDIDASARGPMDSYELDDGLHVYPIRYKPRDQTDCMGAWDEFLASYDAVMAGDYFRTVCIDTQDKLLKMQRFGYFGTRKASQYEYATPNGEFLGLFDQYDNSDKILILTTHMDKEYKEKKSKTKSGRTHTTSNWTGRYVAKGKLEIEENVPECNIELYRYWSCPGCGEPVEDAKSLKEDGCPECGQDDAPRRDFGLQIDKLRVGVGPDLEGKVIEGRDEVSFPNLMAKIFPDTGKEDWE